MRPFELASALLINIYLILVLLGDVDSRLITALVLVLALSILIQLWKERPRWQMYPIYLISAAILFATFFVHLQIVGGWPLLVLLLVLIFAVGIPYLLPVPLVAKPGGPYPVGTTTATLTDSSRFEIYGRDPTEARRFQIQIWYPAAPRPSDRQAPWMPEARVYAPAISKYLRLPSFFLDQLNLVTTPAYLDSPLAAANGMEHRYPVIIFSHGWNGFRAQNTGQMLELASQGYVVVGLQHPYGAITTVFPDGTEAPNNPAALPLGAQDSVYDVAARKLVDQWAGDIGCALDHMQMQARDQKSLFYDRLDFERVGIFGHSTGGGAAIEFCGRDSRCRAGLTEDAFMTPVSEEVLNRGVQQPFFFIFSETFPDEKNIRLFNQLYSHLPGTDRVATILGTAHFDFTDIPRLTPLARYLGLKGPIKGKRVTKILDDYLLAFFNHALKGQPTTLLDGPAAGYPEVRFSH
jgi:pimeloyl-ACP methyl ester carboxylesterase